MEQRGLFIFSKHNKIKKNICQKRLYTKVKSLFFLYTNANLIELPWNIPAQKQKW